MRLAVFTGPSGGHFYPALAFWEAFKKHHPEAQILFVTGNRGRFLTRKVESKGEANFEFLPDFPFPRPTRADFMIRLIPFLLKLVQAFLNSQKILKAFQPDLSVGFGSYAACPGLWISRRKKIPTLIHEQNRELGLANAWLARFVDFVALSFDEPFSLCPSQRGQSPQKGTVPSKGDSPLVIGLPLRSTLVGRSLRAERVEPHLFSSDRFRILLFGGSQGAHSLNRLWEKAIEELSHEEKQQLAVIHITGEKDFARVQAMYLEKGLEAVVFAFHEAMEELYPEADLAITRGGAGTLFELALFGLPALVLPYPHAGAHQDLNARYFAEREAVVLLEGEVSPSRLKQEVWKLICSPAIREKLSVNLKRLARPDASERLVEVAESLLEKKKEVLVP